MTMSCRVSFFHFSTIMSASMEAYLANPCWELAGSLRKTDWLAAARSLSVSVPSTARKQEIREAVEVHLLQEELIRQQQADAELNALRDVAIVSFELDSNSKCYYFNSGILMRKFHPPDTPARHTWKTLFQVVVPSPFRSLVLQLAHDGALGH